MSDQELHSGGCLCGAVRYEVTGKALQTTLCHCEDCRKASGAPAVCWTFFRTGGLRWIQGKAKLLFYANRERTFCGDCGSPLTFFDPAIPELFEANTNTLDHPDRYPPTDQCWNSDEVRWFRSLSELPSCEKDAPLPTM